MSTLHLVYSINAFEDCQKALINDDALLLLQDGVYLINDALKPSNITKYYALKADLEARGIKQPKDNNDDLALVDDSTFVDLIVQYDNSISWL